MTTPGDINTDPLARSILAKLADTRGKDTPLGSFAHTVLNGQASLREAAGHSWHGEALQQALAEAVEAQRGMSPEQRADIERDAQRLRDAGAVAHDVDHGGSERRDGAGE